MKGEGEEFGIQGSEGLLTVGLRGGYAGGKIQPGMAEALCAALDRDRRALEARSPGRSGAARAPSNPM
jgi:hypothetical protein